MQMKRACCTFPGVRTGSPSRPSLNATAGQAAGVFSQHGTATVPLDAPADARDVDGVGPVTVNAGAPPATLRSRRLGSPSSANERSRIDSSRLVSPRSLETVKSQAR